MPPFCFYEEDVLQGIKQLESGVDIRYPQKELLQWGIQFGIPFGTKEVTIQQTIYGSNLHVAVNFKGDIPIADPEHSKINPNQLTDTADNGTGRSVVASGEIPELKSLSDQAVKLGAEVQCEQHAPNLQEHAQELRKNEVTDPQGHQNEVSQVAKISQMQAGPPDGNIDQESPLYVLSKAEILGMKWLELVKIALDTSESKAILTILADLKPVLIEYTLMIDQILVGYAQSANGKQIFPKQDNVRATNKKLKDIISKLNPRDIKQILPETIVISEDDFLCALLGLNSEVANHLKSMPKEFREHEPDDYYIKNFIEEKMDYTKIGSEGDIKKCCEDCGFTSARAETLAKRYTKSPLKNHQSLSLWLDRYVDDMFRYVVPVGGDSPRYPLLKNVTDEWVHVTVTRYAEDDDGCPQPSNFNIRTLNNPNRRSVRKKLGGKKGHRHKKWYHGTDHASAISILEEGIQTRRGRAMQDFSDDDGFYLSSNFEDARMWALSWSRPAVIIFKQNTPSDKFKEMNLNNNNETQWAQIVKYNRCGRSRKCLPEKDLRTAFHESDFVLGPRSKDGRNGTPENESYLAWQPSGYQGRYQEGVQQLCIRSEQMAETFGNVDNIEGVIFY